MSSCERYPLTSRHWSAADPSHATEQPCRATAFRFRAPRRGAPVFTRGDARRGRATGRASSYPSVNAACCAGSPRCRPAAMRELLDERVGAARVSRRRSTPSGRAASSRARVRPTPGNALDRLRHRPARAPTPTAASGSPRRRRGAASIARPRRHRRRRGRARGRLDDVLRSQDGDEARATVSVRVAPTLVDLRRAHSVGWAGRPRMIAVTWTTAFAAGADRPSRPPTAPTP